MQQTATPAMRQYLEAKRQYRDAIVFFRMGDFYEMFYEDALVASRALDLTLTARSKDAATGQGIPMCGVPYHAADGYLARLVKQGHRVAICEQVEDPKTAKGLVRREVVRVVSPGTLTDAAYLNAREPAFMLALVADGDAVGAALLDVSTGEFTVAEYAGPSGLAALDDDAAVLAPREVVVASGVSPRTLVPSIVRQGVAVTEVDGWLFEDDRARRALIEQLRVHSLEAFGLTAHPLAVRAAGGLVAHLRSTQKVDLAHVRAVRLKSNADALILDSTTLKHLEVVQGAEGGTAGSLLSVIDQTVTSIGGRLLRTWLLRPLLILDAIHDRLDAVEELASRAVERGRCRERLAGVQDIERLLARVSLGTASPRDLGGLRASLGAVPAVAAALEAPQAPLLRSLVAALDDVPELRQRLDETLADDLPAVSREGGFTRDGVDPELDALREISRSGRHVIAEMEEAERARTGIGSLKIRFNRVFGYYIEISKSNLHAVPPDYHRKQTIAGGERFTTPALKEYEVRVLGADERILARELAIFESLRAAVAAEAVRIQETARALAGIDALAGLAEVATLNDYVKPHVHDGDKMVVVDGRHPVVERHVEGAFVPNDVDLNGTTRQLVVLTGPNMGGKSTYLRQTALLPLLAQAGSFVPAREATLPIVDRLFARVGASDNIARGHSTFMVEMQETAHILRTATSRSLVVLDEIGRGTATFDGLSIAWAVAEYLAAHGRARPKTLFATHYHELTDLADAVPGVVNAHVSAREFKDDIVFLRKIVPGRSDRSYGIQVARLAGLPHEVVARAREILSGLEQDELVRGGRATLSSPATAVSQLTLFAGAPEPGEHGVPSVVMEIAETLRQMDLDNITPRAALDLLAGLKARLDE
ncbi:MAG: DNA mismatch repair protein MutS [Vicinamibacterales bacterium]